MQCQPYSPIRNTKKWLFLRGLFEAGTHGFLVEWQLPDIFQQIYLVIGFTRKGSQVIEGGGRFDRALIMAENGLGQADQEIDRHRREHQAVDVLPNIGSEGDYIVEDAPEAVNHGDG